MNMKKCAATVVLAALLAGCVSINTPCDGFVTLAEAVPDAIPHSDIIYMTRNMIYHNDFGWRLEK